MSGRAGYLGIAVLLSSGCLVSIDDSLVDRPRSTATDAGAGEDGGGPGVVEKDAGSDARPEIDAGVLPVGHWTFDEPEGSMVIADETGHGNVGSLTRGLQRVSPGAAGTSNALAMTGDQLFDVLSLNGQSFPRTGTLSFWFRSDGGLVGVPVWGVFDVDDGARNHLSIRAIFNGAGSYEVDFDGDEGDGKLSFDAAKGSWHRLVVVWDPDAGLLRVVVDGLVTEGTLEKGWIGDGQRFRFGTAFVGALDEVRLYDRALPLPEIALIP